MNRSYLIYIYMCFTWSLPSVMAANCTGRFINPISDICWTCLFPMSIGQIPVAPTSNPPDTKNPSSPICVCPRGNPPLPMPGITMGFWEPIRMVDVTKKPYCFVSLGGIEMDLGIRRGIGSAPMKGESGLTTWHVHYYVMPLLYLLNIIINAGCMAQEAMDIAYMSEIDPLWLDDELTFILNPEAVLFNNVVAQAACAADCTAATAHLPSNTLFWCAGCHGSMYPLTGHIAAGYGAVQTSVLATERMIYKLSRQLMTRRTSGTDTAVLCAPQISPIIVKNQYRIQMTFPVPMVSRGGCKPLGYSNALWDGYKEIPIKGEDFSYFIWRKRNCCVL